MDFTVLPPPLGPPRRAGGVRTPPARALRASLNPACISRPTAIAAPSTSSPAAARTPPTRALRVSLNPACISRPSAAAAAAAKKPKRPELFGDEDPNTKRPSAARDGKDGNENKTAPPATATASKVGTMPRRVDEAPRLPLGNTARLRGAVTAYHAGAGAASAAVAKRKATPEDSEPAVLRTCSRGEAASRSPLGSTASLSVGAADGPHAGANAAIAPVAKRKAALADSEVATLRPCSRGDDGASRLPIRVGDGNGALAPTAKRKVAPSVTEPAKRRSSPAELSAASSASPSPRSSDSGGTVRELLETARTATDAIRRREIERLRAASRRELDLVVRTVEFNDPFISPQDVLR